ncbi:hypothetical protein EYF80_020349 [Liparis tanakae]|uniref:Uncharacterized protein n=1 Tax=Liparis tanakae TaxID=230148 RepID=A0A4Z2HW35_9TELE|nr:hypothetical protein EYF80_020349 [Liparis tanakae]
MKEQSKIRTTKTSQMIRRQDAQDQSEQSMELSIMDHLTDDYANVEEPSGKKKRLSKSPESVYEDVLIEPNRTGATLSGVKKSSCRAAAVVLGLLCLFLLAGLITLGCLCEYFVSTLMKP